MPGVLVVVGVEPRYLERDLTGYFTLPDWFWNQRSRHIHIRLVLRFANLTENYEEWLADRDFCVSLVEVLGETPPYLSVSSISSSTQYRYAGDSICFIQYVFPDRFVDLECPVPDRQTFVVPHVFKLADTTEGWVYRAGPSDRVDGGLVIRRHRLVFAQVLAVVAVEMVLAQSRRFRDGKCQLLIMWCLKIPLEELVTFLRASVVDACWQVHELLGQVDSGCDYAATYDLELWISLGRFQYKCAQNAHGTTSEVVFWFLVRPHDVDWGLRGDQTDAAYIFEQCTRATLRQHLFLEDLQVGSW